MEVNYDDCNNRSNQNSALRLENCLTKSILLNDKLKFESKLEAIKEIDKDIKNLNDEFTDKKVESNQLKIKILESKTSELILQEIEKIRSQEYKDEFSYKFENYTLENEIMNSRLKYYLQNIQSEKELNFIQNMDSMYIKQIFLSNLNVSKEEYSKSVQNLSSELEEYLKIKDKIENQLNSIDGKYDNMINGLKLKSRNLAQLEISEIETIYNDHFNYKDLRKLMEIEKNSVKDKYKLLEKINKEKLKNCINVDDSNLNHKYLKNISELYEKNSSKDFNFEDSFSIKNFLLKSENQNFTNSENIHDDLLSIIKLREERIKFAIELFNCYHEIETKKTMLEVSQYKFKFCEEAIETKISDEEKLFELRTKYDSSIRDSVEKCLETLFNIGQKISKNQYYKFKDCQNEIFINEDFKKKNYDLMVKYEISLEEMKILANKIIVKTASKNISTEFDMIPLSLEVLNRILS